MNDDTIVMQGPHIFFEKRKEHQGGQLRIKLFSMALGFLLAAIAGIVAGYALTIFGQPRFPVELKEASAMAATTAGDVLLVNHGVSGECSEDGGRIIAEYRPLGSGEWRGVKEIHFNQINLEPTGALSAWRMPKTIKPGVYTGRMTIWCFGARNPLRSQFRFNVLGAVRG